MRVKIGNTTIEQILPAVEGIDHDQVRAARQLLDLSAELVAGEIGVKPNYLINIEQGVTDLEVVVAKAIKNFYEKRGVVFTEGSGIKRKPSDA